MARGTFGLKDLENSIGATKKLAGERDGSGYKKKRVSSPLDAHSMTTALGKTQRMYLQLPITQEKVDCVLMELTPSRCVASSFNKRIQSLLCVEDPNIQQLKASILEEGQRDPVLARPVGTGSEQKYEIVYGTRRRFVCSDIAESDPTFTLKAWVANNISDADAKRLAESENDDREDISAWEQAQYLSGVAKKNPSWTQAKIAAIEQVDQKTISRYLQLALLPEPLLRLMASPSAITRQSGVKVVKALEGLDVKTLDSLIDKLQSNAPYTNTIALLAAISSNLKPKADIKRQNRVQIKSKKGRLRANISAHKTKPGQYKIDAFDLTEAEYDTLVSFLNKQLN